VNRSFFAGVGATLEASMPEFGDRFLEIFLHHNRDGSIVVVKSDVHAHKHVLLSFDLAVRNA